MSGGNIVNWAHRDLRPLIRIALGAGWRVEQHGDSHLRWRSPGGAIVHSNGLSLSPGSRTLSNIRAQLHRAGLDLNTRKDRKEPLMNPTENGATPTHATTTLGEVLKQAQATVPPPESAHAPQPRVREFIDSRDVSAILEEALRAQPGRAWKSEELVALVLRVKDVGSSAVYLAIKGLWLGGLLHKEGRGHYRMKGSAAPRALVQPPAAALQPGARTGDAATDRDLEELDEALAALAKIEAMIRKHRVAVKQLADLRKTLAGINL